MRQIFYQQTSLALLVWSVSHFCMANGRLCQSVRQCNANEFAWWCSVQSWSLSLTVYSGHVHLWETVVLLVANPWQVRVYSVLKPRLAVIQRDAWRDQFQTSDRPPKSNISPIGTMASGGRRPRQQEWSPRGDRRTNIVTRSAKRPLRYLLGVTA